MTGELRPQTTPRAALGKADSIWSGGGQGKTIMAIDSSPRVLLVVSDPAERKKFAHLLHQATIPSISAADDRDALEIQLACDPPVIVIDRVTPQADVPALCRALRLRKSVSHAYIVVVVAPHITPADRTRTLESGADEYVTKPANPVELVLRIQTMLRLQHELTEANAFRGDQSRALAVIADLAQNLAAADSLQGVVSRTLAAVTDLACARRVAILLSDPDGRVMTVADALGLNQPTAATIVVEPSRGVLWNAWQSREPVLLSNASDADFAAPAERPFLVARPSVAVPLCGPENVLGILTVADRQMAQPYSEFDLEYLRLLCNIAAAAIHDRLTQQARDEARHSIVVALAQLAEHRDFDTGQHLDRVGRFCVLLACELQRHPRYRQRITTKFISDLERAVPLHDIGKVAIPDHILLKPRAHTEAERAMMRTHAAIGARTIASIISRVPGASFLAMAEEIAHAHHERYDGTGYPRGLRADAIPLSARIAAVADVYDAITTRRVYKEAMSPRHAVAVITAAAGTQFDPDVVDAFTRCADAFATLAPKLADESKGGRPIPIDRATEAGIEASV